MEKKYMEKLIDEAAAILNERYHRDNIIALATIENGIPHARYVNAFYEDGSFYVITYAVSNKMKHIEENPVVAVCAEWFTAHGKGINMGYFGKEENKDVAEKLKQAFSEWIDNGHNNFEDENTCILRIRLTDGLLLSHGTRYEIDFEA